MKVITFHPDADDEITEAALYCEVRKLGLGSDFLGEVEQGLDQISTNPEASQRIARKKVNRMVTMGSKGIPEEVKNKPMSG